LKALILELHEWLGWTPEQRKGENEMGIYSLISQMQEYTDKKREPARHQKSHNRTY